MLYLGVDLGGTNIKAALVNSEGEILCEASVPTNLPRPAEAVCDDIATLCLQLAEGKGRCRCWYRVSGNCGRWNCVVFQQSGLA